MTGWRPRRRRGAVAGAVLLAALAPNASPALGIDSGGAGSVPLAQVEASSTQLPQAPEAPLPQAPELQTPSIPQVTTPPAPQVTTPSTPQGGTPHAPTPQVPTPQLPTPQAGAPSSGSSAQPPAGGGGGGGSAGSAPGAAAPGSSRGGGSTGASGGSARSSAPAAPSGSTPQARHRAHERRVRTEVRRLRACLPSLDGVDRRFLSLRAGLDGAPLSRGAAARALGIPPAQAGAVERRGLRALREACGVPTGAERAVVDRAAGMPTLQPASLLVATGGAEPKQLVDQSRLAGAPQGVKGERASEPSHNEGSGPGTTAGTPEPLAARSSDDGVSGTLIVAVLCLALLATLVLVALRGRRSHRTSGLRAEDLIVTIDTSGALARPPEREREVESDADLIATIAASGALGPASEPPAEPEPDAPAALPAPAPSGPAADGGGAHRRAARPAAVAASGLLSVAARELMRRRRR
jgi:hypothetical protein